MVNERRQSAYFLGLGGMGMAPLAVYMAQCGWKISGQDQAMSEPVRAMLNREGVRVEPWNPRREPPDTLVISSAISSRDTLLQRAREHGSRIVLRGTMLAEMVKDNHLLAVAGSHGKTTTTGMLVHLLDCAGIDFGYFVGGLFRDSKRLPARYSGSAEWVVAEIDESDGTVEQFHPRISLVLNLDWDHISQYPKERDMTEAFIRLFEKTTEGVLIPSGGEVEKLARKYCPGEVRTFGETGDYTGQIDVKDGMLYLTLGGLLGDRRMQVSATGSFNGKNALAALAAAHWMANGKTTPDGLDCFTGLHRRQECLMESGRLAVWEDYAHHPFEVGALLESMRDRYPDREMVTVFQPHRYTRTRAMKGELARALKASSRVLLLPVYAASEARRDGGNLEDLMGACKNEGIHVEFPHPGPELFAALRERAEASRLILFVGAGDITEQAAAFTSLVKWDWDRYQGWKEWVSPRVHPDCLVALDMDLHNKTTFRVGGGAGCYGEPVNLTDLRILLRSAKLFGFSFFALGRGSNLLVPDEGFPGLVVRFQHDFWHRIKQIDESTIMVGAGARLKDLAMQAARLGMSGFEFMEGIPGSVGGSLRMNAGAMGSWMFDLVERVTVMDLEGNLKDLERAAFHAGYRNVEELKDSLVIRAVLKSPARDKVEAIREKMKAFMLTRRASQPRESSAGCIFKNPEGDSAGRIIDAVGLKGLRVGDAQVSEAHANFIVNRGSATAGDIIELIRIIRERVYRETGVELEPEVQLLGRNWEEVMGL